MRLYLVRHGDALGGGPDDGRPLSEWGRSQVQDVARQALERGDCRPVQILHSPKLRAVETARILADVLRPPDGAMRHDGLTPDDDPWTWSLPLARLEHDVMLVSHMPFVAALCRGLLHAGSPRIDGFATAEMHCLERLDGGQWAWQWCLLPRA